MRIKGIILWYVFCSIIFSSQLSLSVALDNDDCRNFEDRSSSHLDTLKQIVVKEKRPIRILSLDGGGIRGVIELIWLKKLEDQTSIGVSKFFDAFVGTSTGGVIAVGLAHGFDIDKILSLYEDKGKDIFSLDESNKGIIGKTTDYTKKAIQLQKGLGGIYKVFFDSSSTSGMLIDSAIEFINAPEFIDGVHKAGYKVRSVFNARYSALGIENTLKKEFGCANLTNLRKPAFITATELISNGSYAIYFFDSIQAQIMNQYDINLWKVLRATSAAPTFFPSTNITINHQNRTFIDGGILANNPTYDGLLTIENHLKSILTEEYKIKYTVVSLGTGQHYSEEAHEHNDGILGWVKGVIDATMQGQSDSTHRIMKRSLKDQYYRLDTHQLNKDTAEMDDVSPKNIGELKEIAINSIKDSQKEEFDRICEFVKNSIDKEKTSDFSKIGYLFASSASSGAVYTLLPELVRDGLNFIGTSHYVSDITATIVQAGMIACNTYSYVPTITGMAVNNWFNRLGFSRQASNIAGSTAAVMATVSQSLFFSQETVIDCITDYAIAFSGSCIGSILAMKTYNCGKNFLNHAFENVELEEIRR